VLALYLAASLVFVFILADILIRAGGPGLGLSDVYLGTLLLSVLFALSYFWAKRPFPNARTHQKNFNQATLALGEGQTPLAILVRERLIGVNSAFCNCFGLPLWNTDLEDISVRELLDPSECRRFDALMSSAKASGKAQSTFVLMCPDGHRQEVKLRLRAIADVRDAMFLDFYEPESELLKASLPSENDERCRAVINSMDDVAFQTDAEGRWTFLNPSWEKLTGFAISDSLGKSFMDSVHPDEFLRNQKHMLHSAAGHKDTCWYDTRLITANGGFRWVEVRAKFITSNTGEVGGMTGTITDIDKRKLTEESLRASGRAMTTLLDRLPGMLYRGRSDRDWTMEYVSDGCFDLTGYEACDFVENMKTAYVDLIHPEHRDYVWHHTQTALTQNRPYDLEYPIVTQSGKLKWVWEQGRGVYSAGGELLALEGAIIDITARKRAEEESKRETFIDPLTGLYNRVAFEQRLEYLMQHSKSLGYPFLLIYLDLDNFKEISQRFGERESDRVLTEIGHRLMGAQRLANTAAWLGSDKFGILVSDFGESALLHQGNLSEESISAKTSEGSEKWAAESTDASTTLKALQIAKQMQQELSGPIRLSDCEIEVTASAGIAVSISGYEDAQKMLQSAVDAAHRAKFLGHSHVTLADSGLYTKALRRGSAGGNMPSGFSWKALRVYYQPVVSLDSRSIAWVEAILYWHHPRRGLLEFNSYLSAAEDSEFLATIGRWLFREVCRQKMAWLLELAERCPETICISLPAACLTDQLTIKELKEVLQDSNISPSCLILDVWQGGASMEAAPELARNIGELVDLGVRLVGHDEIEMGKRQDHSYAADVWRVDMGRVQRDHGLAFLGEIATEASSRGAIAVVSGIKNEEALAMAKYYGFNYGIGSLFCEPVSYERISQLILGNRKRAKVKLS